VRTPRLRTARLLPALGLALLALAGCGGPKSYDLAKTRSCLKDAGMTITQPPADDFVARSALVGSFRAVLPAASGNSVTISFGESSDDAKKTAEGYVRYHAQNVGVYDILAVDRNAVLLWDEHPSDADRTAVTACLK
jgi:hypothetical protein